MESKSFTLVGAGQSDLMRLSEVGSLPNHTALHVADLQSVAHSVLVLSMGE